MVVEFLTCCAAAMLLFKLSDIGVFQFANVSDAHDQQDIQVADGGRLLRLLSIQLIPEIFIDTYCVWFSVKCGLGSIQKRYWNEHSFLLFAGMHIFSGHGFLLLCSLMLLCTC